MSYASVHSDLDDQLATVDDLPVLQVENSRATTTVTEPYCRSTLLPRQAVVQTVGTGCWTERAGLYQVDLCYPLNSGYDTALAMADDVVAAFPSGSRVGSIEIRAAWVEAGRGDQHFYMVPVLVEWAVYTQNG